MNRLTKQTKVSIFLIGLILLLSYLCILFLNQFSPKIIDKGDSKVPELKVQVETAHSINLPLEIPGFGFVNSAEELELVSEVNGLILLKSPDAFSGFILKKDDVIFEIYRKDLELQIEKIQKGIDKFLIDKKELSIQSDQVTNELKLQKEILILSEKELKRMELLSVGDHIPTNQLDQAKMQYLQTKIRTENLESSLLAIPFKQNNIDEGIKQSQIQILEIKEKMLKTTIKAPFDCIVKEVFVEAGAIASPGLKLISLYNYKDLEISVNISGTEEKIIKNHQNLNEIKLRINSHIYSLGEFHRIEGKLATTTKLLKIVFRFNDLKDFIPGEITSVSIIVPAREKYFKIKKEYISNGKISLAVNNSLKQINIIPRYDLADHYIVTENLHDGDKIITTQIPYAIDGSPLTINEGAVPLK